MKTLSTRGPLPPDATDGQGIHHVNFGLRLKERMDALGVECIVRHADEGIDRDLELVRFLVQRLSSARTE